jgi:hypothetical protein
VTLSYNEFDASWIYGVQNLCIVCYVCDFYFLVNGHRIYFIKRKAAIYNVASGGYTRINKEKKIKRRQSTTLEQTGLKRGGNRGG